MIKIRIVPQKHPLIDGTRPITSLGLLNAKGISSHCLKRSVLRLHPKCRRFYKPLLILINYKKKQREMNILGPLAGMR